jgi:molybdopterin synthase catalytic subunit
MIRVSIQPERFDSGAELAALEGLAVGAVASFTGIVRSDDGVTAIELEHYPAMTQASLEALADQATERWSLAAATIIHRVGLLKVGEPVVFVASASAHRAEALEACAFLIDRLKTEAPFWKKEHRGDAELWVEAKASDDARAGQWD